VPTSRWRPLALLAHGIAVASPAGMKWLWLIPILAGCGSDLTPRPPCDPSGIWRLGYARPRLGNTAERVQIQRDAAGQVVVSFPDRAPPLDTCTAPSRPGVLEASGEVSPDGCTVTVRRRETGCTSGESQCERLEVSFTVTAGRGTGAYCRCWDPGPSCTPAAIEAQATRE
jgi:hypothetical protein